MLMKFKEVGSIYSVLTSFHYIEFIITSIVADILTIQVNENISNHSSLHARMLQISFIHIKLMKFKEVGSIYSVLT